MLSRQPVKAPKASDATRARRKPTRGEVRRIPTAAAMSAKIPQAKKQAATAWVVTLVTQRPISELDMSTVIKENLSAWGWNELNFYTLLTTMNDAHFHNVYISEDEYRMMQPKKISSLVNLVVNKMI